MEDKWTWINVRTLDNSEEASALEYIKRARRYSTTADAVRAALVEFARTLGWTPEEHNNGNSSTPDTAAHKLQPALFQER